MDAIERRIAQRTQFMNELYDLVDGSGFQPISIQKVAEKLDPGTEVPEIARYLEREHLVKLTGVAGSVVSLTHEGVREVEKARDQPSQPTEHFAPISIAYAETISHSVVQQSSPGATNGNRSSSVSTGRIVAWSTLATAVIGLIAAVLTFGSTILEQWSDGTTGTVDGNKSSHSSPVDSNDINEYSPTDPAFDPLLEPLGEMTGAPIMLPAKLPEEMNTPVIDNFSTDRDEYLIVFSLVPTDQKIASLSTAETLGYLRAYPEEKDISNQYFEAEDVEEIEIPDGTDAIVRYMVPAAGEGVSQGPFWEGKFDAQGYTYHITIIKPDEGSEGAIKQAVSTMVTW